MDDEEEEEEDDADPMTTAPQLDRPTLASFPVKKPRGRPKKMRTDAANKNAQKEPKKVAQVKRKGGEKEKEILMMLLILCYGICDVEGGSYC
jgi:hypothetical protein